MVRRGTFAQASGSFPSRSFPCPPSTTLWAAEMGSTQTVMAIRSVRGYLRFIADSSTFPYPGGAEEREAPPRGAPPKMALSEGARIGDEARIYPRSIRDSIREPTHFEWTLFRRPIDVKPSIIWVLGWRWLLYHNVRGLPWESIGFREEGDAARRIITELSLDIALPDPQLGPVQEQILDQDPHVDGARLKLIARSKHSTEHPFARTNTHTHSTPNTGSTPNSQHTSHIHPTYIPHTSHIHLHQPRVFILRVWLSLSIQPPLDERAAEHVLSFRERSRSRDPVPREAHSRPAGSSA